MEKIEFSNPEYIGRKNKKNNNPAKLVIAIIVAFLLGSGIMYYYNYKNPNVVTKKTMVSETKVTEEAMEDAIDKVYNSVLCIEVLNNNGDTISSGTGFVYQKDSKYGYVLTNAHVVSNNSNIQGTLSNNKVVNLTVLGTDSYTDLAVLRMDVKDVLQVASIGTSSNIKIGNTVFTVGSPMGSTYLGTVTKGILSGKDRLVSTTSSNSSNESFTVKVLQTDAAISPGNSGGPLVNLAGDVIGITSLKLVNDEVEGMGFAIPIEDAMDYVSYLEKGQAIKRPMMGVQIVDLTNRYLLNRYGIKVDSNISSGVMLIKVNIGYPASLAGLKDGDIITKIDNEKITTTAEFKYYLYKHKIGDTVKVTYIRNGKEENCEVKLTKESE